MRCPCPPAADAPDFLSAHAAALAQPLHGCQELYIFAATVGLGLDRLIGKYSRLAPAKALFFQAIGAERIEALCDQFCAALKKRLQTEGLYLRPRFSPGYGAFPLAAQREIFRLLDCPKRIGLTLNESLLMSPSKSVTALAGISPCPPASRQQGCQSCTKTDCVYKR